MVYIKNSGMKAWSVEDQPREKYLRLGGQKLTDAELLAIVLAMVLLVSLPFHWPRRY
jgi:hypothetical protein